MTQTLLHIDVFLHETFRHCLRACSCQIRMMLLQKIHFVSCTLVLFVVHIRIDAASVTDAAIEGADEIILEFVGPDTGRSLQQARADTTVKLRFRSYRIENSVTTELSPFGCLATSEDRKQRRELTDRSGCPVAGSPVGSLTGEHGSLTSSRFRLADLAIDDLVTVTCYFESCVTSKDLMCDDRCRYFRQEEDIQNVVHVKRDADDGEPGPSRSTSIRVLPSIAHPREPSDSTSNADQRPQASQQLTIPWSQSGPLLYLNPITCSLFLLLLSVFLALYVSFIRSLKRSVEEIKHGIEAQRSRDKFLVG